MNDTQASRGAGAPETRGELYPIRPDDVEEYDVYPVGPPTPSTEVEDGQELAAGEQEAAVQPDELEHPAEAARAVAEQRPGSPDAG